MTKPEDLPYSIEGRELIAETPELRVQILTLADGEEVPWHYHMVITDTFVCLDGPMTVRTKAPSREYELGPGDTCAVPPKTAHQVAGTNGGRCRFVIVQGVGPHDFNPVGG
jgi:quercetin dioxygenase-like cupin family protein